MEKLTRETLKKRSAEQAAIPAAPYIKVGMSSCGIAAGAAVIFDLLKTETSKRFADVVVRRCGCNGLCYAEPLVEVCAAGLPPVVYGRVTPEIAHRIVEEHLGKKRVLNDFVFSIVVKGIEEQ